ncbi:MAG: STAS domain-containing protein [Paracoccaceae bacterium]
MNPEPEDMIVLPPSLDMTEAADLMGRIARRRDQPVTLNALGVNYLGTHCLQILLAAASRWRGKLVRFEFVDHSADFALGLARMGCRMEDITSDGSGE